MRMSKAKLRVLLTEWQTEQDGLIECPGCCERLKPKYFHIDHIQPKIGGGVDRIENRILLCGPCNLAKGDRFTLPGLLRHNGVGFARRRAVLAKVAVVQRRAEQLVMHNEGRLAAPPRKPAAPQPNPERKPAKKSTTERKRKQKKLDEIIAELNAKEKRRKERLAAPPRKPAAPQPNPERKPAKKSTTERKRKQKKLDEIIAELNAKEKRRKPRPG